MIEYLLDPGRDQTNDIGKEGADPCASDAGWISNGGYDRAAQADIDAVKSDDSDSDDTEDDSE